MRWLACVVCACGCAVEALPTDADGAPACVIVATEAEVGVTNIDNTDVLFVVDDGPSMREEQASIQRELPRLLQTMLTGRRPGTDPRTGMPYEPFTPLRDLHVGVISADLGTSGIDTQAPGCSAWGDGAAFQHAPHGEGCAESYPTFLEYRAVYPLSQAPRAATPTSLASDLACIGTLGTGGCGFAQPLEAALIALWPEGNRDLDGDGLYAANSVLLPSEDLVFAPLADDDAPNPGFLRNDPTHGLSLVDIVIVTDKDDCSAADPIHFTGDDVASADPARYCWEHSATLRALGRYAPTLAGEPGHPSAGALHWLRGDIASLVQLTAITGVPPALIDPALDHEDDAKRNAYYDGILADPRMQPRALDDGTLASACESELGRATPAPRLVDAVRRFGRDGRLLSICDADWTPLLEPLIPNGYFNKPVGLCLPHPLRRRPDHRVDCRVLWELSPPSETQPGAPERCDEVPGLLETFSQDPITERGGERCLVRQLAVTGTPDAAETEAGYGWFYDDFSHGVQTDCSATQPQRIAFTEGLVPSGVVVKVQCHQARYVVPALGDLVDPRYGPTVMDPCDPADPDACARRVVEPGGRSRSYDRTLFCDPVGRVCSLPCGTDASCPDGWSCDGGEPPVCEPDTGCRVPG